MSLDSTMAVIVTYSLHCHIVGYDIQPTVKRVENLKFTTVYEIRHSMGNLLLFPLPSRKFCTTTVVNVSDNFSGFI